MSKFEVTAEELRNAAKKLEARIADFEESSTAAYNAGMELAGEWEGDAQVAFVQEQEKAKQWYGKMVSITKAYTVALNAAAAAYEAADLAAKTAIL